jgi:methenyltetrahydromethanopterin cyclohydrolase
MVCRKCTRSERFNADCRAVADLRAQAAGWAIALDGSAVCPRCPQ